MTPHASPPRISQDATTLPSVDGARFRTLMGSLMSGVSILTTARADNTPIGMTCSAVCSVSAEPPLLLACVQTPSSTLEAITDRGSFAVNFLDAEANGTSDLFAGRVPDKFAEIEWCLSELTGTPLLGSSVAHAECAVHRLVEAGDHVIVLGRIVAGEARPDRFPLGYWRGCYTRTLRIRRRGGKRR
ncbi:flavin reductase family protein [Streptomyces sp. NPDC005271]|uniref:flavin reductase family protein n=1 Tax=unclassified Streptomyces TaxID=2593676 RepID=UPI0033BDB384